QEFAERHRVGQMFALAARHAGLCVALKLTVKPVAERGPCQRDQLPCLTQPLPPQLVGEILQLPLVNLCDEIPAAPGVVAAEAFAVSEEPGEQGFVRVETTEQGLDFTR